MCPSLLYNSTTSSFRASFTYQRHHTILPGQTYRLILDDARVLIPSWSIHYNTVLLLSNSYYSWMSSSSLSFVIRRSRWRRSSTASNVFSMSFLSPKIRSTLLRKLRSFVHDMTAWTFHSLSTIQLSQIWKSQVHPFSCFNSGTTASIAFPSLGIVRLGSMRLDEYYVKSINEKQ